MINVILASGNAHKAEEFNELFSPLIISVKAASEKLSVDEAGTSYFENALLKATAYYEKFKIPVLADDSGLEVEGLPGELGIYSARFGGENLSDKARAHLLLEKLGANRNAYFTCVLCFYFSPSEIFYFEGRMKGSIAHAYKGEGGFGYDPVFIPEEHEGEKTLAELPEWKNKHSHRAIAASLAQKFFSQRA